MSRPHCLLITLALLSTVAAVGEAGTASIAFRSVATATATSTSLPVDKPGGVAEGDFLLAQIMFRKGTDIAVTAPSGWTLLRRDDNGQDIGSAIYYKLAGDAEPSEYTWVFNQGGGVNAGILAYSGVASDHPIIASSGAGGDSANLQADSITAEDGAKLVAFHGIAERTTLSTPAGMTERYQLQPSGNKRSSKSADEDVSAGATGPRTSGAGSAGKWVAQLVGLRVAPPEVKVSAIAPDSGANHGPVSVEVTGDNFRDGATTRLTRDGEDDVLGTGVTVVSSTRIACIFDITGAALGTWNVVVTNDDGQFGTLEDGFTVVAPRAVTLTYCGDTQRRQDEAVTLAAKLTAGAVPVPGQTVTFVVGSFTASAVTDAEGIATVTVSANRLKLKVGVHQVHCWAREGNGSGPARFTATLEITPIGGQAWIIEGEGWLLYNGSRCAFKFRHDDALVAGFLTYVDVRGRTRIEAAVCNSITLSEGNDLAIIEGECTVNGVGGQPFTLRVRDSTNSFELTAGSYNVGPVTAAGGGINIRPR